MNELTFLDLAVLLKIDSESTVEKFGSAINTSFFETANLLGTMKLKGYLDIMSSVGGLSRVLLTDAGASILSVANEKSREPLDALDSSILSTLASGVRDLDGISAAINIRQGDLAYHLHKLASQQYIDYTLRSAKVSVSLTEKGFNSTGGMRAQTTAPAQPASVPAQPFGTFAQKQTTSPASPMPSTQPASTQTPAAQPASTALSKPISPQTTLVAQPKQTAGAPPWVPKNLVSVSEAAAANQDVDALMMHEQKEKAKQAQKQVQGAHARGAGAQSPHAQHPKKPHDIKLTRFFSKLSYYAAAYLPYLVLLVLFCIILLYALTSVFTKPT